MQNEHVTYSDFATLCLSRQQLSLLREAAKTEKPPKRDSAMSSEYFEETPAEKSITILEYFGIVPEDVRYLADIDFLSPLDPDKNPIANDNQDKCYVITEKGKQYLRHVRRDNFLKVSPIIISIIAIIISIISLIFSTKPLLI